MADSVAEKRALSELLVRDLRSELSKRNLDTKGVKKELIERLSHALRDEGSTDPTSIIFSSHCGSPATKKMRLNGAAGLDESKDDDEENVTEEMKDSAERDKLVTDAVDDLKETIEETNEVKDSDAEEKCVEQEEEDTVGDEELDPEAYEQINHKLDCIAEETPIQDAEHTPTADVDQVNAEASNQFSLELGNEKCAKVNENEEEEHEELEKKEEGGRADTATPLLDEKKRISDGGEAQAKEEAKEQPEEASTDTDDGTSLWVSGVAKQTKAAEIKTLFEKYGKAVLSKIITCKKQEGDVQSNYAAVKMSSKAEADLCFENLHNTQFNDMTITVEQKPFPANIAKALAKNSSKKSSPTDKKSSDSKKSERSKSSEKEGTKRIKDSDKRDRSHSKSHARHSESRYRNRPRRPVHSTNYTSGRGSTSSRGFRGSRGSYRGSAPTPSGRLRPLMSIRNTRPPPISSVPRGGLRGQLAAVRRGRYQVERRPEPFPSQQDYGHDRHESERRMREELRQRELEHKAREQQLKLQKEEERLRFERERLEREKLEFQQLKLSAEQSSYSRPIGLQNTGTSYDAPTSNRRTYEQLAAMGGVSGGPTALMSATIEPPRRSFPSKASRPKSRERTSYRESSRRDRPSGSSRRDTRRPTNNYESRRPKGNGDEGRDPKSISRHSTSAGGYERKSTYGDSRSRGGAYRGGRSSAVNPSNASMSRPYQGSNTTPMNSGYGRSYPQSQPAQQMTPSWRNGAGGMASSTQHVPGGWTQNTQMPSSNLQSTYISNRFDTNAYNKYTTNSQYGSSAQRRF